MPTLLILPFDIHLRIIQELDVADLFALKQTCRDLRALGSERAIWLALADAVSRRQPLPLPPPPSRYLPAMASKELESCLLHACKLDRNWSSPNPTVRNHSVLRMPAEDDYVFTLMNLNGLKEIVTSLHHGALLCWDIETGRIMGKHKTPTGFEVSRWRDSDNGATILFRDYFEQIESRCGFQVIRLVIDRDQGKADFKTVWEFKVTHLPILYTFIQDNYVGVLSGSHCAILTLLDLEDISIRTINTGLKLAPRASTIFSMRDELYLCENRHTLLDIHVFPFRNLLEIPPDANEDQIPSSVRPTTSHTIALDGGMPHTAEQVLWYTLSRRWENLMAPGRPLHSVTFLSSSFRVDPITTTALTTFSNFDVQIPIDGSDHSQYRFVSDIPVTLSVPLSSDYLETGQTGRSWPIVALERRYAIWLEGLAADKVLRLVKCGDPTNGEQFVPRTLIIPPDLDLRNVTDLTFDESFGAVFVMTQGAVWVLKEPEYPSTSELHTKKSHLLRMDVTVPKNMCTSKLKQVRGERRPASANWLALRKTLPKASTSSSRSRLGLSLFSSNDKGMGTSKIVDTGTQIDSTSTSTVLAELRAMVQGTSKLIQTKADPGKYLAMDCEMVGIGPFGTESSLARVSMVNFHGAVLLDDFVKQRERVTDYRTAVSGVRESDMTNAKPFADVQARVAGFLKDRILVGHAVHNDLKALLLSHPRVQTRDTQTFSVLRKAAKSSRPALRKLVLSELDITIQGGEHSSVTDARAAMALYRLHKVQWEKMQGAGFTAVRVEDVNDEDSMVGKKRKRTLDRSATSPASKKPKKKTRISSGLDVIVTRQGIRPNPDSQGSGTAWWSTLNNSKERFEES